MKTFIYLVPLICALKSFCQTETKEDFVNEVYKSEVNKSYRYYYLSKYASKIYWHHERSGLFDTIALHDTVRNPDKSELLESIIALEHPEMSKIPGSVLEELYHKANTDTIEEYWDFTSLKKARIAGDIQHRIIKENNRKRSQLQTFTWNLSHPKERKNIFIFSKPIFNKSKEYAIISLESYCGNLCAHRCIYMFRKISGKWNEVIHFECWVS